MQMWLLVDKVCELMSIVCELIFVDLLVLFDYDFMLCDVMIDVDVLMLEEVVSVGQLCVVVVELIDSFLVCEVWILCLWYGIDVDNEYLLCEIGW